MNIEKLIRAINTAEYYHTNISTGNTWKTNAVRDEDGAKAAIQKAIYEWAAEEISDIDAGKRIAELEAKCYTYEKVIANSNFATVAEASLGYCQKIYKMDAPAEIANKIMMMKADSVAEIIEELQILKGGTE